jgi:hypothetical protein
MVAVDTDVLLLAFAFHRDARQESNSRFLTTIEKQSPRVAIYSVMELLGQLSFSLAPERLGQWESWLQNRFALAVLYPETDAQSAAQFFQDEFIGRPLARMRQKMPYVDGLIIELLGSFDISKLPRGSGDSAK